MLLGSVIHKQHVQLFIERRILLLMPFLKRMKYVCVETILEHFFYPYECTVVWMECVSVCVCVNVCVDTFVCVRSAHNMYAMLAHCI